MEARWAVCPVSFARVEISGWFSGPELVAANLKLLNEVKEVVATEPHGSAWQLGIWNALVAHPFIQGAWLDSQEFGGLCFGQNRPGIGWSYGLHQALPYNHHLLVNNCR